MRQTFWELKPIETMREIRHHARFRQIAQHQLCTPFLALEFLRHGVHRMCPHHRVYRPIRAEHQEASCGTTARYKREPIQGSKITLVQVFHHQHQRPLQRQRFHRLGEFPQHAIARGPTAALVQYLIRRSWQERRHLQRPAWCLLV
jgi:hypothetical protein